MVDRYLFKMEFPSGIIMGTHIVTEHIIINTHTKWAMNFADMFLVSYFFLKNHLHTENFQKIRLWEFKNNLDKM